MSGLQTQHLLDSLNVRHSGAGTNSFFALQPTFWTEQGVRIAFLGQCNRTGRQWNYQPFLDAGYDKPGFAHFFPPNLDPVLTDAAELLVAELSDERFAPLATYTVAESPTWAHSVVLEGRVLVKDVDSLALWRLP